MTDGKPSKKDRQGLFLGFQFGLTILGGLAAGYWLDNKFGWSPVGALAGFFGGAVAGFCILVRAAK